MAGAAASPSRTTSQTKSAVNPSLASPQPVRAIMSPASNYERVEANIGEGAYGKVHKARDVRTGKAVAVKKAKNSAADRDVGGIGFIALREVKVMTAIKHPNVMGCLDVFVDGGALHLVMDFMDGDLKRVIEDKSLILSESHVKCLSRQLLQGVRALHQMWFVHRDVTPGNILVHFATGVLKLTDFGFTRTIGHGNRPLTSTCTTLWYRAPELFYGARFYGMPIDIWSSGCVMAEMLQRKALFAGRSDFDMLTIIFDKRGTPTEEVWKDVSALPSYVPFSFHPETPFSEFMPTVSAAGCCLLGSMIRLDPKRRLTADAALSHEFFNRCCEPHELPFAECQDGSS
eukprot:TRINITY_DN54831_c0_g1_i1.p1 TRINITY_DN54831_c0_g1~~TRINITY_DN54831_c0_g1_i1.p1  ORF type:complete len:344 (+),score=43.41 TRINITY_DN54831_c0_g1_i1:117-1148(+)